MGGARISETSSTAGDTVLLWGLSDSLGAVSDHGSASRFGHGNDDAQSDEKAAMRDGDNVRLAVVRSDRG